MILPPLNEALHQGSTHRLLQKEIDDRLKAYLPDISPGFRDKKVEPLHHLIGASPASIRGWWLQKKRKKKKEKKKGR